MVKKKSKSIDLSVRRSMIEPGNKHISMNQQCSLLDISRSGYYYKPIGESSLNLEIMGLLDRQYTKTPFYGVERMHHYINSLDYQINIKRIRRLLRLMGLEAIYPKKRTTVPNKEHRIYPYLLNGFDLTKPNQVWSTDITYIQMENGFLYLVAIIDWYSRYVISWRISNSMENTFCIEALQEALGKGKPLIFNTDQGSQFTSNDFTSELAGNGVKISMDGKGRCLDNVFVERLWRTVKYEYVYLHSIKNGHELWNGLNEYFTFYNEERGHKSLGRKTPVHIHFNY